MYACNDKMYFCFIGISGDVCVRWQVLQLDANFLFFFSHAQSLYFIRDTQLLHGYIIKLKKTLTWFVVDKGRTKMKTLIFFYYSASG